MSGVNTITVTRDAKSGQWTASIDDYTTIGQTGVEALFALATKLHWDNYQFHVGEAQQAPKEPHEPA